MVLLPFLQMGKQRPRILKSLFKVLKKKQTTKKNHWRLSLSLLAPKAKCLLHYIPSPLPFGQRDVLIEGNLLLNSVNPVALRASL